jgi:hypothetical protein
MLWVLCVVRQRPLQRADHSSRGVLPTVVRRCVWSRNLKNEEAMTRVGSQSHREKKSSGPYSCYSTHVDTSLHYEYTCYLSYIRAWRRMWAGLRSRYSDRLRAERSGDRIPVGERFSAPVQTCPGAHPASCTKSTGSFPGLKSGRGVTLTPHPF